MLNIDEVVKSHQPPVTVIPAKAGIQYYQTVLDSADASLRALSCGNDVSQAFTKPSGLKANFRKQAP
jgi:hypothetical protein